MKIHIEINIIGQVQGVGFRMGALHKARDLKLAGWVENNPDGSVNATVEGPEDVVQQFIVWCHEGTFLSRVDQVTTKKGEVKDYATFEIIK